MEPTFLSKNVEARTMHRCSNKALVGVSSTDEKLNTSVNRSGGPSVNYTYPFLGRMGGLTSVLGGQKSTRGVG